ncbi:MAG TPA: aspartate 1-decarboxylase [Acidimicrobiales bacterium]|jgi:aspartate 1-decarboxylase|nr:aspartate 1-decarboxylase [Acidimicrobiales bacterium]
MPMRLRRMLKAKVHRVTVTDANLHYTGSLTLDAALIAAADCYEFEEVDVVNVNNGERFSTYLIAGGPGECCLNGAAARLGAPGDLLIVMAFDLVDEESAASLKPRIVHVDAANRPC